MPTETKADAVIEAISLEKSFGPLPVLRNVSISAAPREILGIIGPSGGGKSTLLRCLNLLEIPDSGRVLFRGEAVDAKRRSAVQAHRARVAMVFQQFHLWAHKTVLENVTLAPLHVRKLPKKQAIAESEALLARVGLFEKRHSYPGTLSGGQQQRVAIARALAMEPEVILFDEPTSALDPELVGEVVKVIRGLAEEGRTMVIVSHEMRLVRDLSTRVVFMEAGVIAGSGAPAEVFGAGSSARMAKFIGELH